MPLDRRIRSLFGIDIPILQAPMAGAQGSAMAIAVSEAGGLGALPGALLTAETMRAELALIRQRTAKPVNLNFFCHTPPVRTPPASRAGASASAPIIANSASTRPPPSPAPTAPPSTRPSPASSRNSGRRW